MNMLAFTIVKRVFSKQINDRIDMYPKRGGYYVKKRVSFDAEGILYLTKQSSEMKALIDLLGEVETYYILDPFTALINQIIYQSISFKAANTIWQRFYDNFAPITPLSILSRSHEELKVCGLSHPKATYIHNIANAFEQQLIRTDFDNLTDQEIIDEVTKIKGVGIWTAQMFLIFCLNRPNVMSYGDLAIRKGIEWLFDIDHPLTKEEFAYFTNLFTPYNTLASHYLWEITIRNHFQQQQEEN